jgi:leader peptidase (prepilin peptidase)/N-methyltransferase
MRFQLSTVRRDVWWPGRAGPQHGVMTTLLTSSVLVVAGLCAGTGARLLLRRLRRGTRVPPPWCELGVASAWGASGAAAVPVRWLPVLLALGWLAVAAGTVDVLAGRLPDALTLPALPTALLLLVSVGGDAVARGVAGAVVAVAAHAAVHFVAPAAMGGGDVKLAAPLGAVLAAVSWEALALAGVLAALSSGVLAVAVLVRRGRGGAVPHGPSMLLACLLVAAAGARGP